MLSHLSKSSPNLNATSTAFCALSSNNLKNFPSLGIREKFGISFYLFSLVQLFGRLLIFASTPLVLNKVFSEKLDFHRTLYPVEDKWRGFADTTGVSQYMNSPIIETRVGIFTFSELIPRPKLSIDDKLLLFNCQSCDLYGHPQITNIIPIVPASFSP